ILKHTKICKFKCPFIAYKYKKLSQMDQSKFQALLKYYLSCMDAEQATQLSKVKAIGLMRRDNKYASSEKIMRIEDTCNWRERCEISNYYLKVLLACQDFLREKQIIRI